MDCLYTWMEASMLRLEPVEALWSRLGLVVRIRAQVGQGALQSLDGVPEHAQARIARSAQSPTTDTARMMVILDQRPITIADGTDHFRLHLATECTG